MSIEFKAEQPNDEQTETTEVVAPSYPWFSIVLIAAYTAVFVAQMATGLDASIVAAGDDKDAVVANHEFWRMLTGAALHGGLLHYAMNSYAFYSFGRIFEMLSGRAHLPIVFLLSAISGSILSLIVNPHGISVGASGGIVGVVGYLAVYSFKRRKFISSEFRRNLIVNIGIILFYGLVLSIRVDNAAHIGGLVLGALYALFQIPTDEYADPRETSSPTQIAGFASMGIYIAVCAFSILLILRLV